MNTEDKKPVDPEDIDTISVQVAIGFAALRDDKPENVRVHLVKPKALERKWSASAGLTGHAYSEADGETAPAALVALRGKILDSLGSATKRLSEATDGMKKSVLAHGGFTQEAQTITGHDVGSVEDALGLPRA